MKATLRLVLLVAVLYAGMMPLRAQDPHFSQFNAAPLYLNPGMTGVFNGNYRLSAIYRSQWGSILKGESVPMFRTIAASYDMRIGIPITQHDAFGWGLSFFSDKAGESEFGTNHVSLSISYLKALNNQGNHYLTLGFQASGVQRGINYNNLRFGNQFDATINDFNPLINPLESNLGDNTFWFIDMAAGLMWFYSNQKRNNYWAGVALAHFNKPDQSFYTDGSAKLPMKITGSAGVQVQVGNQVDLLPSLLVLSQGPAFETSVGTYVKVLFEPNANQGNAFYVGPWYRIVRAFDQSIASDALVLAARFDVSSFSFGFSYDLNFSDLTEASNARGAFEVSAVHVGAFKQKSKVKFCPRF